MSRFRFLSTTTLRAYLKVFSVPGLRVLFADQIAAIEAELMARDLPLIAEESGGYLVVAPRGVQ